MTWYTFNGADQKSISINLQEIASVENLPKLNECGWIGKYIGGRWYYPMKITLKSGTEFVIDCWWEDQRSNYTTIIMRG